MAMFTIYQAVTQKQKRTLNFKQQLTRALKWSFASPSVKVLWYGKHKIGGGWDTGSFLLPGVARSPLSEEPDSTAGLHQRAPGPREQRRAFPKSLPAAQLITDKAQARVHSWWPVHLWKDGGGPGKRARDELMLYPARIPPALITDAWIPGTGFHVGTCPQGCSAHSPF